MAPNPVAAVRRAARAEKAVEQARTQAEQEWRTAWWETTTALAAVPTVPREDAAAAVDAVAQTLGQSKSYVAKRRMCGRHFSSLEGTEALIPRFAMAAVEAKVDPGTAAELIVQAEHEGASLREFNAMLTGRSWTQAPENMTAGERLHVARTELRQRPHDVLADEPTRISADEASIQIRASRAPRTNPEQVEHSRAQFEKQAARAFQMPEIPTQHLLSAAGEIASAIVARDIHGLEDQGAWRAALVKIRQHLELAEADSGVWSNADRRLAQELGITL